MKTNVKIKFTIQFEECKVEKEFKIETERMNIPIMVENLKEKIENILNYYDDDENEKI